MAQNTLPSPVEREIREMKASMEKGANPKVGAYLGDDLALSLLLLDIEFKVKFVQIELKAIHSRLEAGLVTSIEEFCRLVDELVKKYYLLGSAPDRGECAQLMASFIGELRTIILERFEQKLENKPDIHAFEGK